MISILQEIMYHKMLTCRRHIGHSIGPSHCRDCQYTTMQLPVNKTHSSNSLQKQHTNYQHIISEKFHHSAIFHFVTKR